MGQALLHAALQTHNICTHTAVQTKLTDPVSPLHLPPLTAPVLLTFSCPEMEETIWAVGGSTFALFGGSVGARLVGTDLRGLCAVSVTYKWVFTQLNDCRHAHTPLVFRWGPAPTSCGLSMAAVTAKETA